MVSDDLQVMLEFSSYKSDLRKSGIGSFESRQRMELFEWRMDGFCVFNLYLGILNKL